MTYDGIFIKAQVNEIKNEILGEHIAKITETSPKEVEFHVRKNGKNQVLSLSANPNFPHILLSEIDTDKFTTPPAFCMLLRKYLNGGIIKNICQINNTKSLNDSSNTLERIVCLEIENIDDTGDISTYYLFIEIMGKYSNIIITKKDLSIIDVLIKSDKSDDRLKTKNIYSTEKICSKKEIFNESEESFNKTINDYKVLCEINSEKYDISNAICKNYAGISKYTINNLIKSLVQYEETIELKKLQDKIYELIINTKDTNKTLENYLKEKQITNNDSTEKKNVESIIKSLYNKFSKKLDTYKKDLAKCENLNIYKTYGDLIASFGYNKTLIKNNTLICEDYTHDNKKTEIPLNMNISISENIDKYYDKYNKLKRTKENAENLTDEVLAKIEHLDSIKNALFLSNDKNDIFLIKKELVDYFSENIKNQNIKNQKNNENARKTLKNKGFKGTLNYNIHHYKSSDGIDIYVGKNNLQNEYLTFTMASSLDTWLHIKNATGSHVIIKKPYTELSDKTLIEAASLAAYFSENKNETKATVDYTLRKELKKVKGKAPGFCIYHKNYSINVKPEILIKEI